MSTFNEYLNIIDALVATRKKSCCCSNLKIHNYHKCEGKNRTLLKMRRDSLGSLRRRRNFCPFVVYLTTACAFLDSVYIYRDK